MTWLRGGPQKPEKALQEALSRGGGGFVALLQVRCPGCGGVLQRQPGGGRKRKICDSCFKEFRRQEAAERYLKMRKLRGEKGEFARQS